MSADSYLTINCDHEGCDTEGHWPLREDPHTHTELRRLLKKHRGWDRRRRSGRLVDLCPDHADAAP